MVDLSTNPPAEPFGSTPTRRGLRAAGVVAVGSVLFALFFAASALLKASVFPKFVFQTAQYRVVSGSAAEAAAWAALVLEVALAALFAGRLALRTLAIPVSILTIVIFSGLVIYGWAVHGITDCGCMGPVATPPAVSLAKNLALLIGLMGLLLTARRASAEGAAVRAWWATAAVVFAVLGTIAGVLMWRAGPVRPEVKIVRPGLAVTAPVAPIVTQTTEHRDRPADVIAAEPTDVAVATPSAIVPEVATPPTDESPFAAFSIQGDPQLDLTQGELIVAMLSTDCEHCAAAVPYLNMLAQSGVRVVGLVLVGQTAVEQFSTTAGCQFTLVGIPSLDFLSLVGSAPPRFHLVRQGDLVKHFDQPQELLTHVSETGFGR